MQVMDASVEQIMKRQTIEWTFSGGLYLNGLISLFRAFEYKPCRRAVLDCMENNVSPQGEIIPAAACRLDLAACGKALFFALDETGEERYKKALDTVAGQLKTCPLPETPAGLYAVMPFLAEYDTRFGSRQNYKAITGQFKAVHKAMFDSKTGLYCVENGLFSIRDEGFMLLALANTVEMLDMQIYEHYRTLADLFLNAVRLPFQKESGRLFSTPALEPGQKPDFTGNIMAFSTLLKGIRLGLLDREKYLVKALIDLLDLETACEAEGVCDPGVWLFALAEGQKGGQP